MFSGQSGVGVGEGTIEAIRLKYKVDESTAKELLDKLKVKLDKNKESPIYKVGMAVYTEGMNLPGEIKSEDINKLKTSVMFALNLLDTLEDTMAKEKARNLFSRLDSDEIIEKYPDYKEAIRLLEKDAKDDAIGKAEFWTKFKGALLTLAGVAVTALAFVGLPITFGGSVGLGAAGAFLFTGGLTLFSCGRQESIAEKESTLANQAKRLIYS